MLLRIVAEGMAAYYYYNRDPLALRALLQRLEEQRPRLGARESLVLDEVIKQWVKQTHMEPSDA